MEKIKLFISDNSEFKDALIGALKSNNKIEVVGSESDGEISLNKIIFGYFRYMLKENDEVRILYLDKGNQYYDYMTIEMYVNGNCVVSVDDYHEDYSDHMIISMGFCPSRHIAALLVPRSGT